MGSLIPLLLLIFISQTTRETPPAASLTSRFFLETERMQSASLCSSSSTSQNAVVVARTRMPSATLNRPTVHRRASGCAKRRRSFVRTRAVDTEVPSSEDKQQQNKIETPFGTIDLPQLPELPNFELPNVNANSSSSSSSSSSQQDAVAQFAQQFAKTMEESIPKDVRKNMFRTQYTTAASARFLFFLTNSVISRGGSRADIDGIGVASTVAKILLEENKID